VSTTKAQSGQRESQVNRYNMRYAVHTVNKLTHAAYISTATKSL